MTRTGRRTDLSRNKPGYRSRIRDPETAIRTRRLLPRPWTLRRRPVPVEREIDLTVEPEGEPTARADADELFIEAHVRSHWSDISWTIFTRSDSPQGTATTVMMLLGTGAGLAVGGFLAAHAWALPVAAALPIVALLLLAPLGAYLLLRPRQ